MNKLVSVMIPVFNGENFIAQAIDSVINQDYPAIEIIVVNDGSTDKTLDVVEHYRDRIKIVDQTSQGLGIARQAGINHATGDYFAPFDADDLWTPYAIRIRLEALEANPDIQIVFGHQQYFFDTRMDEALKQRLLTRYEQKPIPAEIGTTAIFSRETFEKVGQFTTNRQVHPFLDWYSRAKEKGIQSMVLPDLILHRRIHDNNMSRLRIQSTLPLALKQMLDRRRKLQDESNQ